MVDKRSSITGERFVRPREPDARHGPEPYRRNTPTIPPDSKAEREAAFPGSHPLQPKCHIVNFVFQVLSHILATQFTTPTSRRENTIEQEGNGRRCTQKNALTELDSASVQRRRLKQTRVLLPAHTPES